MGGHAIAGTPVDHDRLGRAQSLRGSRGVHRGVAAAVDDDASPEHGAVAFFESVEHRYGVEHLGGVARRDLGVLAALGADADERGVETELAHRRLDVADRAVHDERDAHVGDAPDLGVDDVARQSVLGDAVAQHAPGQRRGFVDHDLVAQQAKVVGRGQARGPGSYDEDTLAARCGVDGDGPPRRDRLVAQEALDGVDTDGLIDLHPIARGLARMEAGATHDRGQGVLAHDDAPRGLVVALLGVVQPALDVFRGRTGVRARRQAVDVDRSLDSPRTGLVGETRAHAQRDGEGGGHSSSSCKSPNRSMLRSASA